MIDITPVILTRDEEANIGRTLAQLAWAAEVLVVDSMSTDGTLAIARSFPNVRVVQRELDTLAAQTMFGLAQTASEWVMIMDADYFVPAELAAELATLAPPANVAGYQNAFVYAIGGRPLRATLYPPRIVLARRAKTTVTQDGHAHRIRVDGEVRRLEHPLIHDDRKSFARFVQRQRRYMREEAEKLRRADPRSLNAAARIRKLVVVAPLAVLVHTLLVKGLILDGLAGLHYAFERFVAECILSWELLRGRRS